MNNLTVCKLNDDNGGGDGNIDYTVFYCV